MPVKGARFVYDLTHGGSGLTFSAGWWRPISVREVRQWTTITANNAAPPELITLPQDQVLTRILTLPAHDDDTITGLLRHTVRQELPFPENVELRFAWAVIAATKEHSTILLAAARQDAVEKAIRDNGGRLGGRSDCRIVPAFAPLFNLFVARFPAKRHRVYALLHLTPRTSFLILCRAGELLAVQNLPGLAVRGDIAQSSNPMTDEEAEGLCGRLAPLLQRTMHSLETEQKLPNFNEVVVSGACPFPASLAEKLAALLGVPAAGWPDCGVPPGHLLALGLAETAAKPRRDGFHLFEFVRDARPAPRPALTPLAALRFACHCVVVVLLFLSLQMTIRERGKAVNARANDLVHRLIALQPAVAAGATLHQENEGLLRQLARERRSMIPDYATVLARLGELTPPEIAIREITIGGSSVETPGPVAATAGPRRIAAASAAGSAADTGNAVSPTVTISGVATDAMAFTRFCQNLEQARLLFAIRCRHGELAADGKFAFALEGTL